MANKATFYSLSATHDKFEFAAKLIAQLWRKEQHNAGQREDEESKEIAPLWVLCNNQSVLQQMDGLLWSLNQDSFIPHKIIKHYTEFNQALQSVIISLAMPIPQWDGIIINLSPYAVKQFQNNNIIEIISHLEEDKIIGRERYKHYQQLVFDIKHHQIA